MVGVRPGAVCVGADPGFGVGGDAGEEGMAGGVGGGPVKWEGCEGLVEAQLEGLAGAGEEGADEVAVGGEGGQVA